MRLLSLFTLLSISIVVHSQAEIVSWVDENGVRHYGNVHPTGRIEQIEFSKEIESDPIPEKLMPVKKPVVQTKAKAARPGGTEFSSSNIGSKDSRPGTALNLKKGRKTKAEPDRDDLDDLCDRIKSEWKAVRNELKKYPWKTERLSRENKQWNETHKKSLELISLHLRAELRRNKCP